MWKFIKLRQDVSPFAQVSAISSLTDLRPVIYDLEENRVEGAGFVEPNLPMKYQLNIETLQGIKRELKNPQDRKAILLYDTTQSCVFFLAAVPSIEVASACLLSILSDVITCGTAMTESPINNEVAPSYERDILSELGNGCLYGKYEDKLIKARNGEHIIANDCSDTSLCDRPMYEPRRFALSRLGH